MDIWSETCDIKVIQCNRAVDVKRQTAFSRWAAECPTTENDKCYLFFNTRTREADLYEKAQKMLLTETIEGVETVRVKTALV